MADRLLVLELNELSPVLMERFIAEGHLPSFERFRSESTTFITEAGESGDALNPWVQWVTAHTGLTAAEHGVSKLGTSAELTAPTVADAVTAAGGATWMCGSMNVRPPRDLRGCFLPDPWALDVLPHPADLLPFARVVSANVQEHTSARAAVGWGSYVRLAAFLLRHGVSRRTALHATRQVLRERRGKAGGWRRAEVLDEMQWDVFRWYFKRSRPRFATFFSNSTAHFQHLYWQDMEPARFDAADAGQDRRRAAAILDGYRSMDALLGRVMDWAGAEVTLVFCTALSQTANPDATDRDGFYRPQDLPSLPDRLGLEGVVRTAPVMAEQFHVFFSDDAAAEVGAAALAGAMVEGRPALEARRTGSDVFVGCSAFSELGSQARLVIPATSRELGFHELFQWAEAPRSGSHHPDGMFWIRAEDRHGAQGGRVPLTAVAPTLLDLLGIDPPPSMTTPSALGGSRAV